MNRSNWEHMVLLTAFMLALYFNIWPCLMGFALIWMIELDQSRQLGKQWYLWFTRPDTKYDILLGHVGMVIAWLMWELIKYLMG